MSSWDFKPGVNRVLIDVSRDENEREALVEFQFELNGLEKLTSPVEQEYPYMDFYIYIFLTYYNGGKDFEIISSAQYFIEINNEENELGLKILFTVPAANIYTEEDFILNYYSLDVFYSDKQAEDASDINMMLSNFANRLFSTKLELKE